MECRETCITYVEAHSTPTLFSGICEEGRTDEEVQRIIKCYLIRVQFIYS